jgi:hypothetical protein
MLASTFGRARKNELIIHRIDSSRTAYLWTLSSIPHGNPLGLLLGIEDR